MWFVSVSTSAVVDQWASSAGGSPRIPTRSTPPFAGRLRLGGEPEGEWEEGDAEDPQPA